MVDPGPVVWPHVESDPDFHHGAPRIVGTRVTCHTLWRMHRDGTAVESLFATFHDIPRAMLLAGLAYAYDHGDEMADRIDRERARVQDLLAGRTRHVQAPAHPRYPRR